MGQRFFAHVMRTLRSCVTGAHCFSFCVAVVILALAGAVASAAVTATGDVLPADDPFPPNPMFPLINPNTGLTGGGNFIDTVEPFNQQTFFEGLHDDGPTIDLDDDFNVNENIFVGQSSFGTLLITAESSLRFMNLVIGDMGTNAGGQVRTGTGVMRINGFGSLFNSDFNILPPGLPTGFQSVFPRANEGSKDGLDGADEGFDLYVGRFGQGTLEITAGGRAEIHDAVFVGDMPGSVGTIIVDGIDSYLGSGGLEAAGTGELHQTIIGRQGTGFMTISNGGTVLSEATQFGDNYDTFGAVIGSDPQTGQAEEIEPGGRGEVNVVGPYSRWIVGGSMQIGGFQEGSFGAGDIEGLDLEYNSEAGRGTLRVQAGGLVVIRPAIDANPDDDDLRLLIGRFGRVELSDGGQIQIGYPGTTMDNVQILNDGIISGSGRIDTGIFRNRHLGEVRVGPAEKLLIDSGSEFRGDSPAEIPLVNWGVIQVLGTSDQPAELEIERAPNTEMDPVQPFRNRRVPRPSTAPLSDFWGGLISAQHSILRFRSGLENSGMLAFTKGSNYITGDVLNTGPAPPDNEPGIINVLGEDVRAIFENDLFNAGVINVQGGAVVEVLARHSFVNTGDMIINLNPTSPTHFLIGGDAGISGELTVTLSGFSPGELEVGDTFEIMSVAGHIGGVDASDPLRPRPDLSLFPVFQGIDILPGLSAFGLPADAVMIPIFTEHSILLGIRSILGLMGADFNGDGFVDLADLAILEANIGITMGATPLQGDADRDGDVDGDDFLLWQRTIGPVPASGFSSNAALANVPEPAGVAILLGGLLALAGARRRQR